MLVKDRDGLRPGKVFRAFCFTTFSLSPFQGCHLQPMAKKDKIGGPGFQETIVNPLASKSSCNIPIMRKKKQ
jgi:hypothetical protein